jgi:hypothetical protein
MMRSTHVCDGHTVQPGAMELGEGESGAVAHFLLSGDVALLLLDQLRRIALRLIDGLLRGLLGRSLLVGAGGTVYALSTHSV